ncbi:MAG: SDR family NAD(P)-dependent oxidoreductase [Pseudomonadota bacterium]
MNIKGQAALVTGGASGMGADVGRMLIEAGARVTLLDMNQAGLRESADAIGCNFQVCDVSDAASAERAIESAACENDAARILVNCAGIAPAQRIVGRDGPSPLENFKRVIDINLVGTFNMMRIAAARMMQLEPLDDVGERGVVINTASVAAFEGQIGQSAYASSKGGVVSLGIVAAREFASKGIRVMTIAPGLIGTPMLTGMPQEVQDSLASQVPFPSRFGRPDEFSSLVKHICENQMLNGDVMRLDGAIRMAPR